MTYRHANQVNYDDFSLFADERTDDSIWIGNKKNKFCNFLEPTKFVDYKATVQSINMKNIKEVQTQTSIPSSKVILTLLLIPPATAPVPTPVTKKWTT